MVEEIEKGTGSSNPESDTDGTAWRERRRFHRREKPPMEFIRLPVMVWDHRAEEWKRGAMRDATLIRDIITLTWTNVTQNTTDNRPDEDEVIDISFARSIAIQVDTASVTNSSTDLDINVETSPDGVKWDTEPYAECNIGDNQIKTFLVTPGPAYMRLRLDENNTGSAGCKCRILIRE